MENSPIRNKSFQETIDHYQKLRQVVFEFTQEAYGQHSISLREINYSDAVAGDKWRDSWNDPEKRATWEWTRMYHEYHTSAGAKRFDMALIVNGELLALCYGVPTSSKMTLKINALGRKPENNPLEGTVLGILFYAADAYARLLGSKEIWLCDPMNEKLVSKYEKFGFSPQRDRLDNVTHLVTRINYD